MSERTLSGRRLVLAVAGAAMLVASAACVHARARPSSANPFSDELAERHQIQIRILNMSFNDATVWALVRDTRHERLGMVTGKSEATFKMEWSFSDVLSLEFDLIGGVRCVTDGLSVDPGEIIELQISVDPSQDPACR